MPSHPAVFSCAMISPPFAPTAAFDPVCSGCQCVSSSAAIGFAANSRSIVWSRSADQAASPPSTSNMPSPASAATAFESGPSTATRPRPSRTVLSAGGAAVRSVLWERDGRAGERREIAQESAPVPRTRDGGHSIPPSATRAIVPALSNPAPNCRAAIMDDPRGARPRNRSHRCVVSLRSRRAPRAGIGQSGRKRRGPRRHGTRDPLPSITIFVKRPVAPPSHARNPTFCVGIRAALRTSRYPDERQNWTLNPT